jgi:hypothetical protein
LAYAYIKTAPATTRSTVKRSDSAFTDPAGHIWEISQDLLVSVLVPMARMGGMPVAVVDVVDMVAMRNGLVAAALTVLMSPMFLGFHMGGLALIPMVTVGMMDVSIVKVVDVVLMLHRGVSAFRTMDMGVVVMTVAGHD